MPLRSRFCHPVTSSTCGAALCLLLLYLPIPIRCWSQTRKCSSIGKPNLATNERPSSGSKSPNSIVVVLDADAPPETLKFIAKMAKKTTCETDVAQNIEDLSKLIGFQSTTVEVLKDLNPSLAQKSQGKTNSALIPPHTEVVVPEVSPPPSKYAGVHVAPGTTVSELADRLGNPTGPISRRQFLTMNVHLKSLDNVPAYTAVKLPRKRELRIVTLADGLDAESTARAIAAKAGVRSSSPNYEGLLERPIQISRDALASTGAHYDIESLNDDWFVSKLAADKLLSVDLNTKDKVIIAILDSGIDLSHPAFTNDFWTNTSVGSYSRDNIENDLHGYDFVNSASDPQDTLQDSHGTHVAGIASARFLGRLMPLLEASRLDDKIKLMILRVADDAGNVGLGPISFATDYAAFNGALVVSASWTMRDYPHLDEYFRQNPRTLFVVAAGNGDEATHMKGVNIDENKVFPASYKLPNVITVGASDPDGNIAYFSNWGPKTVDLAAPGVKIKSTVIHTGDEYALGYNSGSSQAAPFVTLTAALIFSTNNVLPIDSVKKRILYTADETPDDLKYTHYGRLNMVKALAVNQDLIETRDHSFYRGTIVNQLIHFSADGADCSDPEKLMVAGEKIFRVVVDFDGSASQLFKGTHVSTGRLCDATVTIKTESGSIELGTTNIHDIIWRGFPQFDLPN